MPFLESLLAPDDKREFLRDLLFEAVRPASTAQPTAAEGGRKTERQYHRTTGEECQQYTGVDADYTEWNAVQDDQ